MCRVLLVRFVLSFMVMVFGFGSSRPLFAEESIVPSGTELPGTQPLTLNEPLDVVMVRGINQFAEQELVRFREKRRASWLEHPEETEAGRAARAAARVSLRKILGIPGELEASPILFVNEGPSQQDLPWGETSQYSVRFCEWPAFDGVTGCGLISIPKSMDGKSTPIVVVVPDADQTPEQMFGLALGLGKKEQLARRCADAGCVVLCPLIINRECLWSSHPSVRATNLSHREFLYRLSFELGLHPVGMEVACILTGIQAVQHRLGDQGHPVAVIGMGEGGLLSLAAGAIDREAIQAVGVQGYFNQREQVWKEPIYRNLNGQLVNFGDAEIASLINPRPLIIDAGAAPEVAGPPVLKGAPDIAAPGRITTPGLKSVQAEFQRAKEYAKKIQSENSLQLISPEDAGTSKFELVSQVLTSIGAEIPADRPAENWQQHHAGSAEFLQSRMKGQISELVEYTQRVLNRCQKIREVRWDKLKRTSLKEFTAGTDVLREEIYDELIGRLTFPDVPLNPRSRKVLEEDSFVGYEVVLDCIPPENGETQSSGVIAGGILMIPKDLKPGERRPVVVFQHGLEATPMSTITTDESERPFRAYQGVSTQLVKKGYVVYAPQNPYRGEHEFRSIQRKSNPVGRSLFSYIIPQHERTLQWLAQLPYVDSERIAFYGISYGGKTAMRVPSMLPPREGKPGYCLSICSADFNDWIRKNCSVQDRYSYVFTKEYEIFEWNMGHLANYAELSWLILPRPFMVERGLDDLVAPDEWVAAEFARTYRLYAKLGLPEQTEMEVFDGPHAIYGQGTFRFLERHLNWPGK